MSCCETLKVDIRARYKTDDILEQPYLNPLKKYTVCSIRWMGMQLLIRNSMQLIVRSISLPVYFMQSPILTLLCPRPVILK
jgi:hypothetical protein